jgi:hypothetical protein
MSPNKSSLDRGLRALVVQAAIGLAVAIDAGSVAELVLFVLAAVMVTTGGVGLCPLYRLIRFESRGHRPRPH